MRRVNAPFSVSDHPAACAVLAESSDERIVMLEEEPGWDSYYDFRKCKSSSMSGIISNLTIEWITIRASIISKMLLQLHYIIIMSEFLKIFK